MARFTEGGWGEAWCKDLGQIYKCLPLDDVRR